MNYKLLFTVLGLIFSMNLSAQNDFRIGLHAGLNYPDIRGHELARYNNFKIGYLVGVSLEQPLTENLSLKANVNYERKVRKLQLTYYDRYAEESGTEDFSHVYEYVNLPVLIKYKFGGTGFFANGGPFLNYLLNDKIKPEYPIDDSNALTEQKKIDFGLSVGIGTSISLNGKNDLSIEIRDDFGVIDTGGVPTHVGGTVKTNTVKLIVGWNLGI